MPSVEDEETGQVNLSSNTTTTANNNIIQFWNVILLCAKYISTYNLQMKLLRMKTYTSKSSDNFWYLLQYTIWEVSHIALLINTES